jgi:two-component system chemotaxis response regulator CheB
VLEKSAANESAGQWEQKLIATVKLISRIKVITHPRARLAQSRLDQEAGAQRMDECEYGVVALGASTGGPGAVLQILRGLPADFPLPVLVVIHLGELFATALAEWLDGQSPLRVRYANHGEALPRSGVIMAPPGKHIVVSRGHLWLNSDPERHACRPSVDTLFESIAREFANRGIACLLTGMGKDGALGMLAARQAGAMTIAQNESSSVVFGMPGEAIRLGAARLVLSIEEIAPTLAGLASRAPSSALARSSEPGRRS